MRSVTSILGIDIQAIFMTMLALVGLYLVLKNATGLNTLVKTVGGQGIRSLAVLQGRNPKAIGV